MASFPIINRLQPQLQPWQQYSQQCDLHFSKFINYEDFQTENNPRKLEAIRKAEITSKSLKDKDKLIKVDELNNLNNDVKILRYNISRSMRTVHADRASKVSISCADIDAKKDCMIFGAANGQIKIYSLQEDEGDQRYLHQIGSVASMQLRGQEVPSSNGHNYGISQIKWWPFDNGMFVSCSYDKTVKIWDVSEMEMIYSIDNRDTLDVTNNYGHITSADFSPTKQHGLLAITSEGQNYGKLYDLRTMENAVQLFEPSFGETASNLVVKWSLYDENLLAMANDEGFIGLWDTRYTNKALSLMQHGTKPVNGLCWTADSLVSSGMDNIMFKWNTVTGESYTLVEPFENSRDASKSQKRRKGVSFVEDTTFNLKNFYRKTNNPVVLRKNISEYLLYPAKDCVAVFELSTRKSRLATRIHKPNTVVGEVTYTCVVEGRHDVLYCGTDRGVIETWGPKRDILNEFDYQAQPVEVSTVV